MSQSISERQFYAETYDVSVSDWPGEIDFYHRLADEAVKSNNGAILEVACGTGRVAIRLAQGGMHVVGLDRSPEMLEVARQKSTGLQNMRWVQGDMRSFELEETFGLVIIPGHAFQNILTAEDQIACLECIKLHLNPGGKLVVHLDHQDVSWLGDLCGEKGSLFEAAERFVRPKTGRQVRTSRAWFYERSTQTAIVQTIWEEMGVGGRVINRWETGPIRLHCVFRFEMEHLLRRVGFEVEAVHGDFFGQALKNESSEMIWLASYGSRNV